MGDFNAGRFACFIASGTVLIRTFPLNFIRDGTVFLTRFFPQKTETKYIFESYFLLASRHRLPIKIIFILPEVHYVTPCQETLSYPGKDKVTLGIYTKIFYFLL